MVKLLIGLLGGVWGYVAVAGASTIAATSATYYVVHNANAVEISSLKLTAKTKEAASVTKSLTQLQGFIDTMQAADTSYYQALNIINGRFAALEGEFKNATTKPLPVDCKPDDARVRAIAAAVAAANKPAETSP